MRISQLAMVLSILLCAAAPASAVTTTLLPSADNQMIFSTADPTLEDTVFNSGDLGVGCNYTSSGSFSDAACGSVALQFALPPAVLGSTIQSATLRLEVQIFAADFQTQYRVAAFASSWNTNSITDANQPLFFTSFNVFLAPPTFSIVEIDVTDIVSQWARFSSETGLVAGEKPTTPISTASMRWKPSPRPAATASMNWRCRGSPASR